MFWIGLLVLGGSIVLFQLGALKVWVAVFQIALWVVSAVAVILGLGLIWNWLTTRRST